MAFSIAQPGDQRKSGPAEGSGPGKRALDAALNLVPFIDLLSCCIAFLLITAVWSQSAQLSAKTRGEAGEEGGAPSRPWSLLVAKDGCTLTSPSGEAEALKPETLAASLRRHNVGEELVVSGGDRVPYDLWIRALDAARGAGVVHLQVAFDG